MCLCADCSRVEATSDDGDDGKRHTNDMSDMGRMRVSDDEGYENRCDESTSQDLGSTSSVVRTKEQRR